MRIAVTGAAGYIGGHLTAALARAGHQVFGMDQHPNDAHIPGPIMADGVPVFRHFDLVIDEVRRYWLASIKPDVVVHLAALYGRVWGEKDLMKTAMLNAGMTAALARDCTHAGARLMFASSSEVYGRTAGGGVVDETSPLCPLNMYGLSKKWGEEACRTYCPDGLVITRLNMPYGPARARPRIGTRPHTSGVPGPTGYNALHTMLWQAHHGMPIHVHEGTARCYTWVEDTIAGMLKILHSGQEGTWNVSRNDDHVSSWDLAQKVLALTGSQSPVVEEPRPQQVTPYKILLNRRLEKLGWEPEVSMDEGMKPTLDYYARFDDTGRWAG